MQKAAAPNHQARYVSGLKGQGGGRQGRGGCRRGRQGGPKACLKGIVPQEEVDKVTTVEAKWYPHSKYSKFTPPKKQKHYQLMKKTNKTNKISATVAELMSTISSVSTVASAISEITARTNKCTVAIDGVTNDDDAAADSKWGWNHNNSAVAGHQEHVPKKPKT
jgi:hypothetical protein